MELRYVCRFHCHQVDHEFVLPRQSPLGIYEDGRYRAKDKWPIDYLCWQHGQMCSVGLPAIHLDTVPELPLGLQLASLWEIEVECARENCGQRRTIYTKYSADETPQAVARLAQAPGLQLECVNRHWLQVDESRMTAVCWEP